VLGHSRTARTVVGLGQVTPGKRKRIAFSELNKDVGQQHTPEWLLGPDSDSRQWRKLGQGHGRFRVTSGWQGYVGTVPMEPIPLREVPRTCRAYKEQAIRAVGSVYIDPFRR
jgi:hypothetical protein